MKLLSKSEFIKLNESKFDKLFGVKEYEGDLDYSFGEKPLYQIEDLPYKVTGEFMCESSKLTSLEGCPQEIGGTFSCADNLIVSLVDGPQIVGGDYQCDNNRLQNLDGLPEQLNGNFDCSGNKKLTREMVLKLKESGKVKGKIWSDYGEF